MASAALDDDVGAHRVSAQPHRERLGGDARDDGQNRRPAFVPRLHQLSLPDFRWTVTLSCVRTFVRSLNAIFSVGRDDIVTVTVR